MKESPSNHHSHFLSNSIGLLILIVAFLSFNRFVTNRDYIVGYEGVCDPSAKICFVGCDSEECLQKNYYVKMQKYAMSLYQECGEDITNCEEANQCLPGEDKCVSAYCDPDIDGDSCSKLPEEIISTSSDEQINSINNLKK